MKDITLLRKVELFSTLEDGVLEELLALVAESEYLPGEVIVYEGMQAEAVYFVLKGKVKVYKLSAAGGQTLLNVFGPGDVLAEAVLFTESPYPATVEVMEPAVIGKLTTKKLERFITTHPGVALQLIRVLSKRLAFAQQQVHRLTQHDTLTRTASVLVLLANKYGVDTQKGVSIELNITREELAHFVGTTRETISRALSQLHREGLLNTRGRRISITDFPKLQRYAGH